jgi:sugar phosphate isomerase/epimerase
MQRRNFLQQILLSPALLAAGEKGHPIGLGFMTYGMKSLSAAEALRICAQIGFDGVEIALMPGYPTEPKLLSLSDRREIRKTLGDLGLALPGVMENLPLLGTPENKKENLERIRDATAMAVELSPGKPGKVETILGRKPDDWEQVKQQMVGELRDWAAIAATSGVVICIKAHVLHAVNSPERALWIVEQVGSPYLRVVFDYSHFYLNGLAFDDCVKKLFPVSPYFHVKDAVGNAAKFENKLAGETNTVDYVHYFKTIESMGYSGFVCIEVSGRISSVSGYDPVAAARKSYAAMAAAFERAGVRRPGRRA